MKQTTKLLLKTKRVALVALVAHDNLKLSLLNWCNAHKLILEKHKLCATGTTGHLIRKNTGLNVSAMLSGPMGGDQQIGALIAEGNIDLLIFFWDPQNAVPHDPDVKALLRLATVWNIPVATNKTTADILITAQFMNEKSEIVVPDYNDYITSRTTE